MMKYLNGVSNNRFDEQLEFERDNYYMLQSTIIYTMVGFVAMKAIVKYYFSGQDPNFLKRAYHYLLRE